MAYTTINKGSDYFNTKLHTGNSGTQSITGVGFQPDFVWIKRRTVTVEGHALFDVARGVENFLASNSDSGESNNVNTLTAFDSDGFSLGSSDAVNGSGNYVSWNWLAANGTSANTDGDISSTVSANTTSGFSVVIWTGNGSNGASVGHGLSQAPEMIVMKNRTDNVTNWRVGQTVAGNTMTGGNGYYMEWDDTKASTNPGSAVTWGSPPLAPTSSVFYVGSNNSHNGSGDSMVCYCFHSVKGFSKIGSYTGNGSASDGPFIYLGFRPAFVMIKRTDSTGSWEMYDAKREGFNPQVHGLYANLTNTEDNTDDLLDLVSNGFKLYHDGGGLNASGGTYIYMAFAEHPFVSSTGTPVTAR